MFDLTGRKALVTGATGGLGGAIARSLHAAGATVVLSGTRAIALEALAAELGERTAIVPANLADTASVEALVPSAEEAIGPLDILVNNAGRGVGFGDRREPHRRLPPVAGGREGHDAPPLRPDHRHRLGGGHHRQSRPGQLCRREGRSRRPHQGASGRGRVARDHGELHRPGLHRLADDRRAQREAARGHPHPRARRAPRRRRGSGGGGAVSGLFGGGLCHRPDPAREWRHGDDLKSNRVKALENHTSERFVNDHSPAPEPCATTRFSRTGG
ncbi:hypothetical protein Lal_00041393 [Lupinus albus]|nr:hypothetical protein Lal_00041393 [Lupinus albus]